MADRPEILIVDDEHNTREALARYLRGRFSVTTAADGEVAIELLKERNFDLVLTDLRMPNADGMSVLEATRSKADRPLCILLTAYGSIGDAVTAVKQGAFDFVPKPVKLDKLEEVIDAALASRHPAAEKQSSAASAPEGGSDSELVFPAPGSDDPMGRIMEMVATVAPTRSTVLLTGESGTGKEVIARLIHDWSGRTGYFVPVHCAALTSTLLESELFGYEKGAFTGASERRKGRFELADHGTIFLDEIGEIDAATQVKLLRVLESRSFERVGGTETVKVDVRLIAATNRDLRKMVAEKSFREDLFYRLSVVNLELPPLRERTEDIEALADHFLSTAASNLKTERKRLTPEALQVIRRFPFPGNVRQLENLCNWLTVMAPSQWIRPDDLPFEFKTGSGQASSEAASDVIATRAGGWTDQLAEVVRELLSRGTPKTMDELNRVFETTVYKTALEFTHGKKIEAAQKLGVGRNTLTRKLQELGLR